MPYSGELASYGPLKRIAESDRVQDLLSRQKIQGQTDDNNDQESSLTSVSPSELGSQGWQPDLVLAVDGSHHEEEVENGYPGAEISYITVAGVLLDMEMVRELDKSRPINPVKFRQTEEATSVDSALPGCNVVVDDELSPRSSLRKLIFETMDTVRAFPDCESLLETYEALLDYKPEKTQQCPYMENCSSDDRCYVRDTGTYECPCSLERDLFSTDALRVHERMSPAGSNGAIFSEIMQALERIWVVHVLRSLEQKGWLSTLGRLAIVIDGPLAVFGQPAWLSQSIKKELNRINRKAREQTGLDMLMLGVEKSGLFVNHFERLDTTKDGEEGSLPNKKAYLLEDRYIKERIIFSESSRPYGHQTYFGRKLLYKTSNGARIVASLPFLDEGHDDLSVARPTQYPRLKDALNLLDQLTSARYPNSVSPLVSAHAEAAIPLNLGEKILSEIAERLMIDANND